jgi:hypothetical protein
MQTVTYKHLIDLFAAATPVTLSSGALSSTDSTAFNRMVNRALRRAWEWIFWPELMLYQERHYRADYSASTAYAAPSATSASEVWYPSSGDYYQALQATTGNAPATSVAGAWVAQGPYWAECASSYSGADWAASTAYTAATSSAAGTIVRNPADGRYYMCHTTHTSGSTFDSTKFGILTPFNAYVGYEQSGQTAFTHVLEIWNADYRTATSKYPLQWEYDELGVRLTAAQVPASCWLRFRQRPHNWRAADYSAGATYAVDDQIYYASGTGAFEGDFWKCLTATTAGQNPSTHAAKWSKLSIPAFLADFAVKAASLGYREGETKLDAALLSADRQLWDVLFDERAKLHQGMLRPASVKNLF